MAGMKQNCPLFIVIYISLDLSDYHFL